MLHDIIYQISIFGDFISIVPTPDIIQSMINKYSEYKLIPTIFQEQSISLPPVPGYAKSETIDRLQMISTNDKITVMFASNRIDINQSATDFTVGLTSDNLSKLLNILKITMKDLSLSKRVALNTTSFIDNEENCFLRKINSGVSFFDDPSELTLRLNKRIDIGQENLENSNVIMAIQKTLGNIVINNISVPIMDKIICQFDINTLAEKDSARFHSQNAIEFINDAEEIRNNIIKDFNS